MLASRHRVTCSAVIAIALTSALPARAQDTSPDARLQRASALFALGEADQKPWHLELHVTVFDDAGKNPQAGTIEMWKSGENTREVFTFGSAVATRLQVGRDVYWDRGGELVPDRATEILDQVLHPGPTHDDESPVNATLQKHKFGQVELDCILLGRPVKGLQELPIGLYPTFCLNPGTDILRSSYNFGYRAVIINSLGKFLDHEIALKLSITSSGVIVSTAQVTALSSYAPTPDQFAPLPDMHHTFSNVARISGGVMAGQILKKTQPVYPDSAKQAHIGGTVVLHALVGRDGHVYALRPVSGEPDLALSALAAVREWTYEPYLLNGVHTAVDTTITVNFELTH